MISTHLTATLVFIKEATNIINIFSSILIIQLSILH